MKIIEISTNKTVAEIITNHGMALDEALSLIGAEITENEVIFDGEAYDFEDLEMVF